MPSAAMPAAPVTAVPSTVNTSTAAGASAVRKPLHERGQHRVPDRQQQRTHRAEAGRQLIPERLQMRSPERIQQRKKLQQHRLHHPGPERRHKARHILPALGQPARMGCP